MPPERELERYLRLLVGTDPGERLIEIRYRRDEGMGQRFIEARRPSQAAIVVRSLAVRTDVYVGVVLRDRRSGGRAAVSRSHLVFVEVDSAHCGELIERAPHPPSVVIASGTAGHAHMYWRLRGSVTAEELEAANRRLAHHLGGDMASVDAARILRPPETFNHKHHPPTPVVVEHLHGQRVYAVQELVDGLEDPPEPAPRRVMVSPERRGSMDPVESALRAISAEEYARVLTGREPNRSGKVACPFHELSVGRARGDGVWPACFVADASVTGDGDRR
jgi:hypothetical protein